MQRRLPVGRKEEDRLVDDMTELARPYGRYRFHPFAALPRAGRSIDQIVLVGAVAGVAENYYFGRYFNNFSGDWLPDSWNCHF